MKQYDVYFIIKMDRKQYVFMDTFQADNAREALAVCKWEVFKKTGRNAFHPSTKSPLQKSYGDTSITIGMPPHI